MEKAYKFRIYPTTAQAALIAQTFGCKRWVYNHFLAERIAIYENEKRKAGRFEQDKRLTQLKKEIEWLRLPDKCALQNAIADLDAAYQNFFRRVKSGGKPGFPKFKSKRDRHQSYKTSCNIKMHEKHVQLPKLGMVQCRISKQIEGRIISATVSQNPSGKYFVSVLCTDVEIQPVDRTGAMVGVDLGLKELAITSDNQHFTNPKHFTKSQKKLAKLQRRLSRKSKGSNNREKARIKVARLHEHIANQRLDNAHKMTTSLVRDYDLIAIETLMPKNMVKNRRLAKAISDAAWGEIVSQLEYKCNWYGKELAKVDRFYPSSQTCNSCGYKNTDTKNLAVREWDCPKCGIHHDRDVNAAKNILDEGLRILNVA
jgi:putative transposase